MLRLKAKKLRMLKINLEFINPSEFLPYLPTLQHLDLSCVTNFGDKEMDVLGKSLPNLVTLNCNLVAYAVSINSLYSLKDLSCLQEFEFVVDEDATSEVSAMLMSQILHVLPKLKVAGALADHLLTDDEDKDVHLIASHIVPLGPLPLALEHLVHYQLNFSWYQAKMLQNLKALKVCIIHLKHTSTL